MGNTIGRNYKLRVRSNEGRLGLYSCNRERGAFLDLSEIKPVVAGVDAGN